MAIEIDNKRMWETAIRLYRQITGHSVGFDKALKGMGLCYKDGEITTIEPKPKYYKCIKEYKGFTLGKIYKTNDNGDLPSDPECPYVIWIENPYFEEFFRPATEEEIPQTNSTKHYNPLKHQGAANDHVESKPEPKKCLFTKDLYTDEERKELCEGCQEECELNKGIEPKDELTEFEKKVRDVITSELCNDFGDVSFDISISDNEARLIAKKLLPVARKLIASEIDATQMTREISIKDLKTLTLGAAYYQGIVNTIKKIKGESV